MRCRPRGGPRGRGRGGDPGRRRAPSRPVRSRECRRREPDRRLRRAAHVGRLDAFGASLFAVARQARLRRHAASLQAGSIRAARAIGRGLQCFLRSCRRIGGGRLGGACGGGGRRIRRPGRAGLRRERRGCDDGRWGRAAASRRPPRQGVRRFPERRVFKGREPGGPGGHALDRAHQALHHDRHGDRPGQALEHERARDRSRRAGEAHPGGGTARPSARPIRRSLSAPSPAQRAATSSIRSAARPFTAGRPKTAPGSRMWAHGSAPGIFPAGAN